MEVPGTRVLFQPEPTVSTACTDTARGRAEHGGARPRPGRVAHSPGCLGFWLLGEATEVACGHVVRIVRRRFGKWACEM